jgi:hypothetical protein
MNNSDNIVINGQTRVIVNDGFALDFGSGGGPQLRFTHPLSSIDLMTSNARLAGTSRNADLCFGGPAPANEVCCPGPFQGNGANFVQGPRTIWSGGPVCSTVLALPVSLLSFTAEPEGDRVQLGLGNYIRAKR